MRLPSYTQVKILAEMIAFLTLTIAVAMAIRIRDRISISFGKKDVNNLMIGLLILWTGYLVNVLNDVIPTEFMKVFDDVLVATGLTWILITSRPLYGKLKLKKVPTKVLNGSKVLKSGGYLFNASSSLPALLKSMSGWKLIAVARRVEKFKGIGIPTLWITKIEGENRIEPTRLAPLLQYLVERTDENTAVIIEGLEYLILENGFESVFKFLTTLKDNLTSKGAVLVLIVDPNTLEGRELKILEREFTWFEVQP